VDAHHAPLAAEDRQPDLIERAGWWFGAVIMALGLPTIVVRLTGTHLEPEIAVLVFGLGILSAAFLLGAASEAAQHDIPASLSLAVLAFVAVLPEYAVDLLFAWRAADDPEQAHFAVANMTGGNRLLLGVGWAMVLFLYTWKSRARVLHLPRTISLEIVILGLATIVAFAIPALGEIDLVISGVLLALFVVYLVQLSRHPRTEAPTEGPAAVVANLAPWRRRLVVIAVFAFSAGVIVAAAEPFADGLIELGHVLGVDEFLLVQWLAPLASESPEFLAAMYLVWRGAAQYGMTALISSKVNQFTLLIASLPIAYAISGGSLDPLPMDNRQREEVFLTAAQSLFGMMLLLDRRLSWKAAVLLLSLFLGQFLLTQSEIRWGFGITYLVLAAAIFVRQMHLIPAVVRDAFHATHDPPGDTVDSGPAAVAGRPGPG